MKSDEGFSNNADKQILIQLVNENVTSFDTLKNLKTPDKSTSLAFFFPIFNVFSMSIQCRLLRCFCVSLEKIKLKNV